MLWIGGKADTIKSKFMEALDNHFHGLDIVQLHLNDKDDITGWRYSLEPDFLQFALAQLTKRGLDLEVLPFQFDKETLFTLLDMGINRYATDEPKKFKNYVMEWQNS